MKKGIKLTIILFILIIILFLIFILRNKYYNHDYIDSNNGEFIKLTDFNKDIDFIVSSSFYEDNLVLYGCAINDKCYIDIIDLNTFKIKDEYNADFEFEVENFLITEDGNIEFYNSFDNVSEFYTMDMHFIKKEIYNDLNNYSLDLNNYAVDDKYIYIMNNNSLYYETQLDNINSYYINKDYFTVSSLFDNDLVLEINNINSLTNINISKLKIKTNYSIFIENMSSNSNYTFISLNDSIESSKDKLQLYLWDYTKNNNYSASKPKFINNSDITDKCNSLIYLIRDKYEVNIYIDKYDDYYYNYGLNNFDLKTGADKFKSYIIINDIYNLFKKFPDEFIKDIYTDYYSGVYNQDSINVYIVKSIKHSIEFNDNDYDTAAFAEMNYQYIYLQTDEYDGTIFSHELMHLIDNRINKYFTESYGYSLDEYWESLNLNPIGFEYGKYDEKDKDYFISEYSAYSPTEERAELFRALFSDSFGIFTDKTLNKAKSLISIIREAYPSINDDVYWDNIINGHDLHLIKVYFIK